MHFRSLFAATCGVSLAIIATSCQTSSTATTRATTLPAYVKPTKTMVEVEHTAHDDLFWLADDAREGRGLGTKGLDEAADFIVARYKKLGLVPVPSLGDYVQPFPYEAGMKLGAKTSLSFNGTPLPKDAFTSFTNSKLGDAKGDLAFIGYGIQSKEHDYDDFAGIDLKGKVALAMRWEPHTDDGKSRWVTDGGYSNDAAIAKKAEQAAKAGATALILVNAPTHHEDAEKLMDPRGGLRRKSTIPCFDITVDEANKMLAAGGAPDLATLQHDIDTTVKPVSRLLPGDSVAGTVDVEAASTTAKNIVAMLPGTGPHADEYVVVGAHYDHVGRGQYGSKPGAIGQIHNGADDNGSGTVTVLELAEEFALAGKQDRTILFCNFTLEELGLIGSDAFVKHLPVPKDKIVAMLNLDMVGRMRNEFLYVGGAGTADAFDSILAAADRRSPIELKSMGKGGLGPSDHLSFSKVGIPVIFLFTGMHADYHAPGDKPAKINYEGIGQVTYLAFDVVRGMCAMDHTAYVGRFDNMEPDTEVQAGEQPTTRRVGLITRSRVTLGVEPDYTADQSVKGVLVNAVSPGSAAEAAGLVAQDVITQMNDRKIDNLYDLSSFLGEAKPDDKVKLSVMRKGAPLTVEVTLRARGR